MTISIGRLGAGRHSWQKIGATTNQLSKEVGPICAGCLYFVSRLPVLTWKIQAMPELPNKSFVRELAAAIDAGFITYREYIPWADRMIASLASPPDWICDLSVKKYRPDVLKPLMEFAYAEPFEEFRDIDEEHLGFLWLRYARRELSWATFLDEAGKHSDASSGGPSCEFFYELLNRYEEANFDVNVESQQQHLVRSEIAKGLEQAEGFLRRFRSV